jgi:hypothetical protein
VSQTQPDPIREIHRELALYLGEMKSFTADNVYEALSALASMNARAAELRHGLYNLGNPRSRSFRDGELRDFFETCEFQFKVFSRLQAVRQQEFDLSRGY